VKTWVSRLGGTEGPTFGVLPRRGIAVGHDSPDTDTVTATVEFDHNGHRLLGVEYPVEGPYALVQLRTPLVPSLVITPNVGAFEPERFTPLEDTQITRNTIGALKPDAVLRRFETGTDFDRQFTVTTTDPDFASAVLSPEIRALFTGDTWFRVREVAFHGGSLWATEKGRLTEARLFTNGRRLALLAAAVTQHWRDDIFSSLARRADTSETSWRGTRRGVLGSLNGRREAVSRQPLSTLSLLVRSVVALALLLPGLSVAGNALAALSGLAPETRLTVTASFEATSGDGCATCGHGELVSGTYAVDGVEHQVSQMMWMSFGTRPDNGDVVDVSVGPLWWHPVIERTDTAVFLLLMGTAPLLAGAALARATYLPRPRKRKK